MLTLLLNLFFMTKVFATNYPAGFCNHGELSTAGIEKEFSNLNPLPNLSVAEFKQVKTEKKQKDFFNDSADKYSVIEMKILFLSATNDILTEPGVGQIEQSLLSLGLPFEHVVLTEGGKRLSDLPLSLTTDTGGGKYYGIVTTTGLLAFQNQAGDFQSALTPTQWSQLEDYEKRFHVRRAAMYSYPTAKLGVAPLDTDHTIDNRITLAPKIKPYATGLIDNVEMPLTLAYHYPSKLVPLGPTDNGNKIQPFAYFQKINSSDRDKPLAGVIVTYPDEREQLHFFFAQSKYSTTSVALTQVWIQWLTRGMYLGKRRMHLNIQIDDVFLSTGLWDPYGGNPLENPRIDDIESYIYRLTADDLQAFSDWQKKELRTLTKNPAFRIEMAFNGRGIWEYGGYARDPLMKKSQELIPEFHWVTHTYTHPDFNWQPYYIVDWELKANKQIAQDLFGDQTKWFSPNSIVTPRISGLFNPFVLQALLDNQLFSVVGDNTRKEILPPNIHDGLYTTKEFNGYDGVLIIPRYATNIFFNASTPTETAAEYNYLYHNHFGRDSTIQEIYERERLRVAKQLLNFEYAPYMFHQGNMRTFPWEGSRDSLLSIWLKEIIGEIRKYSTLPLLHYKMDDLVKLYKERMQFEQCDFSAKLIYTKGKASSILATSRQACTATFTGINAVDNVQLTKWENYGPDITTYFKMKGNETVKIQLR